ncbi:MAG: hypothetical protein JWQ84_2486, partial [Mucilaginibacter sp.]|nr:hypothetical protein [Mucilaginibacter sp.]
ARGGFLENEEVNLIVFDGRVIPAKSKIEWCKNKKPRKSYNLQGFGNFSIPFGGSYWVRTSDPLLVRQML